MYTSQDLEQASELKLCPRCHELLFADMDICYGCLFDFRKQKEAKLAQHLRVEQETAADSTVSATDDTLANSSSAYVLKLRSRELDCSVALADRALVVGRDPNCDIVLHSRAVSKQHLRITPSIEGALIEDLGSTNPALIEGKEIRSCIGLRSGDVVHVCGISFALEELM